MPAPELRDLNQRALLWERTGMLDGNLQVAAPVELRVRWEDGRRQSVDAQGNTIAYDARVKASRDIETDSLMWLAPKPYHKAGSAIQQWHGAGIEADWDVFQVKTTKLTPSYNNRNVERTHNLVRFAQHVPGGWGILRVPGLKLWLNADHGLFTTSAGQIGAEDDADPVGRWVSLDENRREFKQATAANRPSLKTGIINGKQVVRLDGVNDILVMASDVALAGDFTAYLCGDPGDDDQLAVASNITNADLNLVIGESANVTNDSDSDAESTTTCANAPLIARFMRSSSAVTFAGTGQASKSLGTLGGTISLGTTQQSEADLRHVLIFGRALTTPERTVVEDFLKADLGVELP